MSYLTAPVISVGGVTCPETVLDVPPPLAIIPLIVFKINPRVKVEFSGVTMSVVLALTCILVLMPCNGDITGIMFPTFISV